MAIMKKSKNLRNFIKGCEFKSEDMAINSKNEIKKMRTYTLRNHGGASWTQHSILRNQFLVSHLKRERERERDLISGLAQCRHLKSNLIIFNI